MSAKMPFGKYKGLELDEIPGDYLKWVLGIAEQPWLKEAIEKEIEDRTTGKSGWRNSGPKQGSAPSASMFVPPCPDEDIAGEIITAGYRALAKEHHPDRGGDGEKMKVVNSCAEWLRDRVKGDFA